MGREPGRAGRTRPTLIPAFSSGVQWGLKCASLGQHQRKGEIRGNGRGISEAQDTWRARNQWPISLWLPTYGSLNLPEKREKRELFPLCLPHAFLNITCSLHLFSEKLFLSFSCGLSADLTVLSILRASYECSHKYIWVDYCVKTLVLIYWSDIDQSYEEFL